MKATWRWSTFVGALTALLTLATHSVQALTADDYFRIRGNEQGIGRPYPSGGADGPGRSFLRWWDPIISLDTVIDNWESAASFAPAGQWGIPNGGSEASLAIDFTPSQPAYHYARTVNSPSEGQFYLPDAGRILRTFSWTFSPVTAAAEYQVWVNIPIGPTTVTGVDLFQPRYAVYEIEGVLNPDDPGQPVRLKVDVFAQAGGWVRLNQGGGLTDTLWVADGTGQIKVRLLNTIPRDSQNQLTAVENTTIVYADAAKIVQGVNQSGSMTAQPVVGTLAPGDTYPVRVMVPRNEENTVQIGSQIFTYQMGDLSSYDHNATNVDPLDNGTGRRNVIWSWPALRPQSATTAEINRYGLEKRDFIQGSGTLFPQVSRANQEVVVDNLQGSVSIIGTWAANPSAAGSNRGTDFLTTPAGTVGAFADFAPVLNDGDYSVYIWVPNNVLGLATRQRVEIYEGSVPGVGAPTALVDIDMSTVAAGWHRLTSLAPFPRNLFTSAGFSSNLPLSVRISAEASAGGVVYADGVRFVKQADLRMTSTPIFARAGVRPPGSGSIVDRDLVFVALENGRIYCLDAKGDPTTGRTTVYWAYPSEGTNDPNEIASEDGPNGGIAEDPIGFDTSSALIKTIGGNEVLYIGAKNGKVYAIDVAGRGDGTGSSYGTTTRRWTFPDDYDPTSAMQIAPARLGPFVGSLTSFDLGTAPIIVPTTEGRIYALDPAGNPASKTTTVVWRYPLAAATPLPPITMTPLILKDRVIFGTGSRFYSINSINGTEVLNLLVPGVTFSSSSPTYAESGELNGMPDTIFMASDQFVHAFNFGTGAEVWRTNEIASAGGGLNFTLATVYNSAGDLIIDMPVVVVPTIDGGITMLAADVGELNAAGIVKPVPAGVEDRNRRVWEYRLAGQANNRASIAVGGRIVGESYRWMYAVDDLGYIYAFNFDPTKPLDQQTITIGDRPGSDVLVENNPAFTAMNAIATNALVAWITPQDYETLVLKLRDNSITYADVLAAVGNPAKVTRAFFDYGETLYFVIYNLPQIVGPNPRPYYMEVQLNTPGTVSQRRNIAMQVMPAEGNVNRKIIGLSSFPLVGNGANALAPGAASFTTRVVFTGLQNGQQGGGFANQQLTGLNGNRPFRLANPIAIGDVNGVNPTNDIGRSIDPANVEVLNNGNLVGAGVPAYKNIVRAMGPDFLAPGDPVAHGQPGYTQFQLIDRSLMRLVFGSTVGLQNIRFAISDMKFRRAPYIDDVPSDGIDDSAPNGISDGWGTYKMLDPTAYRNYEDLPVNQPNDSFDYPDLRREGLKLTKELNGQVENPLYNAISLSPPQWDATDFSTYRGIGYNSTLNRVLVPTLIEAQMGIPKYQPPSRYGYRGRQTVYVDSDQVGRQVSGGIYREPFRDIDFGLNVGLDERLVVDTPTLDLGSLASGAGQGAGVEETGGPTAFRSWNGASPFSPWAPGAGQTDFRKFFQTIVVRNEGNVNLLNVRLAKRDTRQPNGRLSIPLWAPGLSELSWIDAPQYLHANFDSRFAPVVPGTGANRVIIQKPRPGDGIGASMSVNPKTRGNANLNEPGGRTIFPTTTFSETDALPRVGVTIPIGTPAGAYTTSLTVMEDRTTFGGLLEMIRADDPAALGFPGAIDPNVYVPFAQPGFTLRFNVRETRLTNRNTAKAAPMIETAVTGSESFFYSSQQPTALRDGAGNLVIGFSSNRLGAGGTPAWSMAPRLEAGTATTDQWRIYMSFLRQGSGLTANTPGQVESTLADLYNLQPATGARWWQQEGAAYPASAPAMLFTTTTVGETVDANSMQFYSPAFPAAGAYNLLDTVTDNGRTAGSFSYMAFNGDATIRRAGDQPRREHRIFMTRVQLGNGGVSLDAVPENIPFDPESPKSKPSVVQSGTQATVFYTVTSGGLGQIVWNSYNGVNFGTNQSMQLSNAFESIGAPSAVLRRYRAGVSLANNNQPGRIDMLFTSKMRGRGTSEAYLARMSANINGVPVNRFGQPGSGAILYFPVRYDNLVVDPATGVYWTAGSEWRMTQGAANLAGTVNGVDIITNTDLSTLATRFNASDSYIDLYLIVNGVRRTILDHTSRKYDLPNGLLTFDSTLGGKVYLDSLSGSVRFSGGIVPRNGRLQIRYSPKLMRVSSGPSSNYRSAAISFDDRFIGEYGYWAVPSGGAIAPVDPVRNDRWFLGFSRTSTDGGQTARPYFSTMRLGIQLPTSIMTDANGRLLDPVNPSISVAGMNGGYYQVDPVNGRIFFSAENEDRNITVTWKGVDANGTPIPGTATQTFTVSYMTEGFESAIPIEQAANEGGLAMALDPLGGNFNSINNRRPGLVWLFWTSTRAGVPDLYFQTIAPRFTPVAPGG